MLSFRAICIYGWVKSLIPAVKSKTSEHKRPITFLHRIEYVAWQIASLGLRLLPRGAAVISADLVGWMGYHVFRVRRNTVDGQLKIAFGDTKTEDELRKIGCKSFQYSVLTFFEFVQPKLMGNGINIFSSDEGFEEFGRPLFENPAYGLAVSGHIGNWEAMGTLVKREHIQLAAVAKPMHNPLVNRVIVDARKKIGVDVLQVKNSMKGIVDALRKKKWVAFIGDQDARRRGIFVDFFGKPASTATGVAYFSIKMDIPILPMFCVRNSDSRRTLKLIVCEPIYPRKVDKALMDQEIARITELHTKVLEELIKLYPENYFWLHQRWKTKPKNQKSA